MTPKQIRLQREHQAARGKAESAKIGIVTSCVLAPCTGGTSLWGLIITVPKRSHYKKKERRLAAELQRVGVEPLEKRKRDTAIPICSGLVAAVIGAGIPGLEHIGDAGADVISSGVDAGLGGVMQPDQPLPSHPDTAAANPNSFSDGAAKSLGHLQTAVISGPHTVIHDGIQNLWSHANLANPLELVPGGVAPSAADIAYFPLTDILHNPGGLPGMHGEASGGLVALAGEHVHHAVDLVERVAVEIGDGTFVEKEAASIGKHVTAAIICESINMVLEEGTKKVCDETTGEQKGETQAHSP